MLKTADEIIAEIPKPRKKAAKRIIKDNVLVCGAIDWNDKGKIRTELKALDPATIRYILVDTSKGAALQAISVAKELGLQVCQVHPNHSLGVNALHLHHAGVFSFFKPRLVIAFHKQIETSYSTAMYLRMAKQKGCVCKIVGGKPKQSNAAISTKQKRAKN